MHSVEKEATQKRTSAQPSPHPGNIANAVKSFTNALRFWHGVFRRHIRHRSRRVRDNHHRAGSRSRRGAQQAQPLVRRRQAPAARPRRVQASAGCPRPTTPTPRPWRSWAAGPTCMASPCSPPSNSGDRKLAVANRKPTAPTGSHARNEGNSWCQNTRRWPGR